MSDNHRKGYTHMITPQLKTYHECTYWQRSPAYRGWGAKIPWLPVSDLSGCHHGIPQLWCVCVQLLYVWQALVGI
jgi:hypothetical protein